MAYYSLNVISLSLNINKGSFVDIHSNEFNCFGCYNDN